MKKGNVFRIKETNEPTKSFYDMDILELRGFVINAMISIETLVDELLIWHFHPEDERRFRYVLLNNSVISMGAKIKVCRGLEILDNKTAENLLKMNSIRNMFAHSNDYLNMSQSSNKDQNNHFEIHFTTDLTMMSSNGKIVEKNIFEAVIEFDLHLDNIRDLLLSKIMEKYSDPDSLESQLR